MSAIMGVATSRDARADLAAQIATEHFSLTEKMLRELHARIGLRAAVALP